MYISLFIYLFIYIAPDKHILKLNADNMEW